jgi:hypothetical protein
MDFRLTRRLCLLLALGFVPLQVAPVEAQQSARAFPIHVDSVRVVGERAELGSMIAARLGADGNVYAVDHLNAQVVAFSPAGRLLWRAGRKGRGPGEFQIPYRIAVRPDGAILVLDRATGEITVLTTSGQFADRYRLPFYFSQVDDLLPLSNDQLVLAGTTEANEEARFSGLHRFRISGQELVHAGSFGPLPEARDRAVLQFWGAGPVERAGNGDIVYVRRIPYEIYRFDPTGRQRSMVRPPFKTRGTPDDFMRVERDARGTTMSRTGVEVERPGSVSELLNGWLLVTRHYGEADFWDMYSPSGRYAGSGRVPGEWGGIIGFEESRGILWLFGTQNLEPVLLKVYLSSGARRNPSTRRRSR